MEKQDFCKSQTKRPHRHRVKSVGSGTRMVLKPGMGLAVSVQGRLNSTGHVIGLGAELVDLKFVSLKTKVRLNIGASVLLPYLGILSQIWSWAIES